MTFIRKQLYECFWTADSIYYMQYSPYLRAIRSTLTVWITHEQHILGTSKMCCLHVYVVQMAKTDQMTWWWWVYWNLAAEKSDVIWIRQLLKGLVITVRPYIMASSNDFLISATTLLYFYFMVKNIRLL